VVPTAQQLYAALLDIQLAAASHTHSHNSSSSSSTTTTTTTTTSSAILLPPGALSSQLAAQLSQAVASSSPKSSLSAAKRNINHGHRSLAGKLGCGARKHTTTTCHSPTASPQSSSSTSSSKRGKKTSGRVCAECRTDNTLQWRLGPDGQASLCNACGQRFQRRKQAMAQNSNNGNQQHHKSEPHSPGRNTSDETVRPVTSPSPASSPPSHHHIKREPVASPTHAGGSCGERRSDIYSLLN
jgi:Zn ribbon nucleic-acid-binding protein